MKSQAVCTYGRENFESWGRKKRSIDGEPLDRYLSYIIFVKNTTFVFYVFLQNSWHYWTSHEPLTLGRRELWRRLLMIQPWVYRGGQDLSLKSHHFRFLFSFLNFFKHLLSREIIVLDFGDESTNPYDFDQTTTPTPPGGNCKCCHHLYRISHLVFVEES